MRRNSLICFLLISALLSLAAFREALWGNAMLAPLDLPAAAYPKYRFVDPNTTGIAANYGLNDQLVYDLPIQHTIHDAYRRGEMPWWDPYGFAGHPLLADAHISGTDPVRVIAYLLLPFELAYNWTRLVHFFLNGLGVFLLLRHWGTRRSVCVLLAVTAEFAGYNAQFFGYPWLQASFVYYPFLWRVWDTAFTARKHWHLPAAVFLVAAIFYAGNLQSHTYILFFTAAFLFGYGRLSLASWRLLTPLIGFSLLLGGCLAAPVLFNELELFIVGARTASASASPRAWLSGLADLSCVFPWALGAPDTLDLRNYFFRNVGLGQNYGLGFQTFVGSAGFFLAALGGFKGGSGTATGARRTAIGLIVIVFVILSSPLITIFYSRCAGLAVFGLIVLAAQGSEFLVSCQERMSSWGWTIAALAIIIAAAVNLGSLIIYPRLVPRIRAMVQLREDSLEFRPGVQMRQLQIESFPKEISFKNPAVALAFLSLLGLAGIFLNPRLKRLPGWLEVLLALNFLPVFLLFERLAPCQPVELWHRLLTGGPEQQRVMAAVKPNYLRLMEVAPGRNDPLFPDALEHLYRVHTVHGYSALLPKCLSALSAEEPQQFRPQLADYIYETQRGQPTGKLLKADIRVSARFQWLTPSERTITIEQEMLNTIRLTIGSGAAGTLLWTDTYYPGWTATIDGIRGGRQFEPPCFSKIEIPGGVRSLVFHYQPTFLKAGIGVALFGLLLTFAVAVFVGRHRETA